LISIPHGEEPRSGVSNREARLGPHPSIETRAMRAPQDEGGGCWITWPAGR
jgi:hypothetical protein